jgi:hypothetical protein
VTLRSGHRLHVVDGIGRGYSAVNIHTKVFMLTRYWVSVDSCRP